MKNTGIILELDETRALLLTRQAEFLTIQSKPGMFVGQEVDLSAPAGNRLGIPKYRYAFGIIASIIIFMIAFWVLFGFPLPSGLYAYVSMDINPSIEFAVNHQMRVIKVKSINNDGLAILQGTDYKDMSLNQAVMSMVFKAEQNNYFRKAGENHMLLSATATGSDRIPPQMKMG